MTDFKIERGIAMPPKRKRTHSMAPIFAQMVPGDSFAVEPAGAKRAIANVGNFLKKNPGWKVERRGAPDGSVRFWLRAKPDGDQVSTEPAEERKPVKAAPAESGNPLQSQLRELSKVTPPGARKVVRH